MIHPRRDAMTPAALERFVARLHTRRGPYPSFQVLSHARLKETSDALKGSGYYDRFTPEMLRAVGMPR